MYNNSHHLNTLQHKTNAILGSLSDLENKYKTVNNKINELDSMISKLQSRFMDTTVSYTPPPVPQQPSLTEAQVKKIVKDYVSTILASQANSASVPPSSTPLAPSSTPISDEPLAFSDFNYDNTASIESLIEDDDIVIEEKKKKPGRKPKNPK